MKKEEITTIRELLDTPLDYDNGNNLREQLTKLEAWSARVALNYRIAQKELFTVRRNALLPKDRTYTELDRETRLAADTSEFQYSTDILKDIQDAIKAKVSLGQTILRSLMHEAQVTK